MKRISILTAILITAISSASAQKNHILDEVEVTARRPMKEIGVQKTVLDSIALKESVTLSMADILTYNSSVFVKNYGRATLSTVSFRGTSPSHTQVTWNGMKINNPMMGMTDFSTIPSFFIDRASLLHGTSSVNETGGGLGGLVQLGTVPDANEGLRFQYVQAVGSFSTFDEFARITYHNDRWSISTRAAYSSSPNDYRYVNHDKKTNIYDDNHNIIGQYNPTERNRSGSFKDLHLLQEIYYDNLHGDRFGMNIWYANSNRELPMLTTDYGDERSFDNRQKEQTIRSIIEWEHLRSKWKTNLKGGYIYSGMKYDYKREVASGNWSHMTRSRSYTNTFFGKAEGEFSPCRKWFFSANISFHQNMVRSHDKNIKLQDGNKAIIGYDKSRIEASGAVSAKWQPNNCLGMSLVMRQEMFGTKWTPPIPALFIDALVYPKANLAIKASVSRNYRFPSLNDMYFLPGGNPDLKSEDGFTYDIGISFLSGKKELFAIDGSITWFDSYIDNWIMWLPTNRGFFSPHNVKKVHSYGIESKANISIYPGRDWEIKLSGTLSWTPSKNCGQPMSAADNSVGKQLPYVPKLSSAITGHLSWKRWSFMYKWCYYSQRYTMSSNDISMSGHLPPYFMSNVAIGKGLKIRAVDLLFKFAVNNLFNEDYLSVLGHPMPGINYTGTVSVTF